MFCRGTSRPIKRSGLVVAAIATAAVVVPLAGPALAYNPTVSTLATGLPGPLHLAVDRGGAIYVSSAAMGEPGSGPPPAATLVKVQNGKQTPVVTEPAGEIAGVSAKNGRVSYVTSGPEFTGAKQVTPTGAVPIADTLAYETTKNPDGHVTYGFQGLSKSCLAKLPPDEAGPAPYKGIIESHPYSMLDANGKRYIADAAGNDILEVTPSGLRTVAVLPASQVRITSAMVKANHLPGCVAGHVYRFEPVPTDIEMGPDGMLYVSTLTGAFGLGVSNGKVYAINPNSGKIRKVVGGLNGATGLAVTGNGTIYVAEMFGNQISKVVNGHPVSFLKVPMPGDVEWDQATTPGSLYATTNVLDPSGGNLIRIVI